MKAHLAAIVEASPDAILTTDLKGKITSWNLGAQRLYGYKEDEVLGNNISIVVPPYKQDELKRLFGKIAQGEMEKNYETIRISKDGRRIDVSVSLAWIYDQEGKKVEVASITRDITEKKELERQKDEFIAIASHELKTPLTSIKAFAQILRKRLDRTNDNKFSDYFDKMDKQLDRLTRLVLDILDVAKIRADKLNMHRQDIKMEEVITEAMEVIQRTDNSRQIIKMAIDDGIVSGDSDRIRQILLNLLSNAIKYSPKASKVIVTSQREDGYVVTSVTDYGIGIRKEDQQKIFFRYYQGGETDRMDNRSSGLGLYICSEIVRKHGGKIWVESEIGKGSTFSFSLPLKKNL